MGFPGGLAGKESTCNAGDPDSIPGSGRSPGEGIGYPLHIYSCFFHSGLKLTMTLMSTTGKLKNSDIAT